MKSYKLTIDEKNTVWHRTIVEIEAESIEMAVVMARENEYDDSLATTEWLYSTCEYLPPEENGDQSTLEIYSDITQSPLYTNAKL